MKTLEAIRTTPARKSHIDGADYDYETTDGILRCKAEAEAN
jgi:hypothetical protein